LGIFLIGWVALGVIGVPIGVPAGGVEVISPPPVGVPIGVP